VGTGSWLRVALALWFEDARGRGGDSIGKCIACGARARPRLVIGKETLPYCDDCCRALETFFSWHEKQGQACADLIQRRVIEEMEVF